MQRSFILFFMLGQSVFISCQLYEYLYINKEMNWTEAQQYCREKHTDLATVSNMTDMKRLFNTTAGYNRDVWIGLYDQTDGIRTWYWSLPGVEFNESETKWHPGEPNDCQTENCGCLNTNLKWVDNNCINGRYFLCYDENNSTQKYHLIEQKKTWQKAQSYCREKHTDLISGMKQLQDGELEEVMSSTSSNPFIGLFRDTWRWSDGSSFSFRHWRDDLNNHQYNSGQCAAAGSDDNEGRWKIDNCNQKKPFICYDEKVILIKENKTWEEALNYCRYHYDDLVTITSLDEQRWIQEKAKKASTDYVWMGLHYACTLDLWFWVNDKMVHYHRWPPGEPLDDCDMSGAMETRGEQKWRKKNDSEKFNFLCSQH
ncbi:C-type mannose receptor 2-like isoform X1 [Cyprinodon tularosa]|uniref:C-type mannose receptor 2-like isoform X1 n=1 Tax=Cyprinodon tularosa TaxID=77115 RepID=UPI0018E27F32|nr:C-type mannose receptor 2-like isoform X1 [Cyprinodon tularosa]